MAVRITLDNIVDSTPPTDGWKVEYRILNSTGAYTTPVGSPYNSFPIIFDTTDPAGTLYEGHIWNDCGDLESTKLDWVTDCECTTAGYSVDETGERCKKTTTIAATVTSSDYCLVASGNAVYSSYGSRIYKTGFTDTTLFIAPGGSNTYIYGSMTLNPQWANTTLSTTAGPMNKRSLWIDSDCDGNKDPLGKGIGVITILTGGSGYADGSYSDVPILGGSGSGATADFIVSGGIVTIVNEQLSGAGYVAGESISVSNSLIGGGTGFTMEVGTIVYVETTIAFMYNNIGVKRTVYVGLAADNQFKLVVNGEEIVDTTGHSSDLQFKLFHIIPVTLEVGVNYFNAVATGDGTVNDSIAMVGFDNTASQIKNATTDSALNILFDSVHLRGTGFDIATCPTNYSLDISGGTGNYTCVRVQRKVCNTAT